MASKITPCRWQKVISAIIFAGVILAAAFYWRWNVKIGIGAFVGSHTKIKFTECNKFRDMESKKGVDIYASKDFLKPIVKSTNPTLENLDTYQDSQGCGCAVDFGVILWIKTRCVHFHLHLFKKQNDNHISITDNFPLWKWYWIKKIVFVCSAKHTLFISSVKKNTIVTHTTTFIWRELSDCTVNVAK